MPVGISKVSGIDPPGTIVWLVCHSCAGRLSALEQGVNVGFGSNYVADAEPAGCRRLDRDVRILRQLGPRIQGTRVLSRGCEGPFASFRAPGGLILPADEKSGASRSGCASVRECHLRR
jgi:hypothetical protein